MRCSEAKRLFDPYLDGELSPPLRAELDAHRLECADCRRALAILEVTGHVLSAPTHERPLADDFTNRLMACVETPTQYRWNQIRRYVYAGVPLAAAAVIALAFLGVFDRSGPSKVAGVKVEPVVQTRPAEAAPQVPSPKDVEAAQRAIDEWVAQMRVGMEIKRQKSESLGRAVDLTVLQLLDIFEEFNDRSVAPAEPAADEELLPAPPEPEVRDPDGDVEDL
jgi:anti-sigma factor RsiW